MTLSRRALLKTMAATGAAATSPGVFAPAIAQAKPVRIGILAPRSGIAASAGDSGLRATQWAVERFNAAGGIAGRKIELVVDEETNAKDTIERFQKLVQQEKVDCVQGIVSTGVGLALGPVVEEARALTIFWDGTTQDGVDEKLPNPKYLFRSTDNECEAVMSSLLAIKHWKGQFKTHCRHQPRLLLRPQQHGGVRRAAEALQHRARGRHRAVAQGRHHGADQQRRRAQGRQARPDLLLAAVRRPAGVHEAGARGRADQGHQAGVPRGRLRSTR